MPLVTEKRSSEGRRATTTWTTNGDALEEDGSSRPADDVVFEILRASRRREVLRYLDAHGDEATLGALAEYVAAEENDVDQEAVTSSQRKRTYVGLYQAHLPKMAGNGVIEWDKDRGLVALNESSWWLLAYLYFDPVETVRGLGQSRGLLATLRRYVRGDDRR